MLFFSGCFQDCVLDIQQVDYVVPPHCEYANISLLLNLKSLGPQFIQKHYAPFSLFFPSGTPINYLYIKMFAIVPQDPETLVQFFFFLNLFYPLLFIEKISIDLTSNSLTACSRPCVYMSQRSGSDSSKIYTKNLWFHLLSEIPPHFLVAMVTTNCPLVLPDRKTVGFPLEFQLPNVALNVTA